MKYGHAVKYNGVFYPTGADVPVVEEKVTELEEEEVKEPFQEEVKEPKKEKAKTK